MSAWDHAARLVTATTDIHPDVQRYSPSPPLCDDIDRAAALVRETLASSGTVYACGNGGSWAQAAHLVGELTGIYRRGRRAWPAVHLGADGAGLTCVANDIGYDAVFSRVVFALAKPGDCVIGLTTSGRSANVLKALACVPSTVRTIAITGRRGLVNRKVDVEVRIPSDDTGTVQEVTLLCIHTIAAAADALAYDLAGASEEG